LIYSGSIVNISPENLEKAKEVLGQYEQIEVFAVSDDKQQIVVAIEVEDDTNLEDLCKEVKQHPEIIDIGHHVFHFEEDVEKILKGEKVPELRGFTKSNKRIKNPLEE
jgi:nitrate reductase NapD